MFLILEVLCIILLVNNLPYQKRKLVSVGNAISGKFFKSKTNFTNYFSLKEENQLMMDHNAMLMSELYINNNNITNTCIIYYFITIFFKLFFYIFTFICINFTS